MFGQCGLGPLWKGCVFGVIFNHGAVNESNVSPRDDLVQEGFHRFGKPPPPLSTTIVGGVDHAHIPAVMREDVAEDGMDADMAKMKPRRKTARPTFLWLVSLLVVGLKSVSEEFLPSTSSFDITSSLADDRMDFVVNSKRGEGLFADVSALRHAPEKFVRRHGRVGLSEDRLGHRHVKVA